MGESLYLVKLVTNLHIQLSTVMNRSTLANICRLLDNFKSIKNTYKTLVEFYIDSQLVVSQHLSYHTLSVIQTTIQVNILKLFLKTLCNIFVFVLAQIRQSSYHLIRFV